MLRQKEVCEMSDINEIIPIDDCYPARRPAVAVAIEPGDATHYEMVIVETWDTYEVVILNDSFFDKITFLKSDPTEPYKLCRKEWLDKETNTWTIRAAKILLKAYIERSIK